MMSFKELPTITLAPPSVLTSSRSLNVRPFAVIPLVISLLTATVTAIYVWKLWQREDKFYVEEAWSEDEEGGEKNRYGATVAVKGPDILVHEGRPDTPKSLIAARQGTWSSRMKVGPEAAHRRSITPEILGPSHTREAPVDPEVAEAGSARRQILSSSAKEALARRGISSPFTMRANMPYNIQAPEWAAGRNQEHGVRHNPSRDSTNKLSPNSIPLQPQTLLSIPQNKSTVPMTAEVASSQSIDTWEHSSIGALDPNYGTEDASAAPFTLPQTHDISVYDGRSPSLSAVKHGAAGRSAQSTKSKPETENTEYTAATSNEVRKSGIDWNDDEDSLVSSNFTKYSSGIGRNSYRDRFADY